MNSPTKTRFLIKCTCIDNLSHESFRHWNSKLMQRDRPTKPSFVIQFLIVLEIVQLCFEKHSAFCRFVPKEAHVFPRFPCKPRVLSFGKACDGNVPITAFDLCCDLSRTTCWAKGLPVILGNFRGAGWSCVLGKPGQEVHCLEACNVTIFPITWTTRRPNNLLN